MCNFFCTRGVGYVHVSRVGRVGNLIFAAELNMLAKMDLARLLILICTLSLGHVGCNTSSSRVVTDLSTYIPNEEAWAQSFEVTPQYDVIATQVYIMDHLPTPMPRPEFIREISPEESAIIPITTYNSQTDIKENPIGFPVQEQGYNSQVCLQIDLRPPVAQPGDNLIGGQDFESRFNLQANGEKRNLVYGINFTTGLEDIIETSSDGLTQWISPWTFCWEAHPEVGIHEVIFQFQQTSGDILSYTWYFATTDS